MDMERAQKIAAACIAHFFYGEGLQTQQPPSIKEYSLMEMLEANELVAAENPKKLEGGTVVHMHCDQRFLAALYVAHHYEPESTHNCHGIAYGPGSAVLVVRTGPVMEVRTDEALQAEEKRCE